MRALLVALALVLVSPLVARADPPAPPAPLPSTDGLDTTASRLSDARIAAAHKAFELVRDRWQHGAARLDDVYLWSMRVLDAELQREPINRRDTDTSYKDHIERMHHLETAVLALHKHGLATAADVAAAAFYRSEADFLFEEYRIE